MAVIRLTKEFSFEAAHALDGYDGPCREIHGHSYRLFVTVKGTPAEDASNPKCGMVLDFGVLKRIVSEEIVSRFDHALVLRASESGEEFFRVSARRSETKAAIMSGTNTSGFTNSGKYDANTTTTAAAV